MAVADVQISPWNRTRVRAPVADVGTGVTTLKAKLSEDLEGDPAAIAAELDVTLVEDGDYYVAYFEAADLLAAFEDRIGDVIAIHFYSDTIGYHAQLTVEITASRAPVRA